MPTPDKQLSAEQSRQIAETIREELARRRISRQSLAEQAKLSLSTLEKVLGGRRPFTLVTTVRLEQALGVSLRKAPDAAPVWSPVNGDVAPDGLGAYSRRAVTWLEGVYITLRPSFGDKDAIYAYRTEIAWDAAASSLLFREGERLDAAYTQWGEVAVPNQSGFIYLVTNRHGQHRLITVSGRNVRHHHHAPRRARLAADADRGTDRVFAGEECPEPERRACLIRRRQLRRLSPAPAPHDR
jgi:transcriptional regulator with XRE-family HTH domain